MAKKSIPLIPPKRKPLESWICDAAEVGSRKKAFQLTRGDHKLVRFHLSLGKEENVQTEGGHSCPPDEELIEGQECPSSFEMIEGQECPSSFEMIELLL